jgi:hypothetical protein
MRKNLNAIIEWQHDIFYKLLNNIIIIDVDN